MKESIADLEVTALCTEALAEETAEDAQESANDAKEKAEEARALAMLQQKKRAEARFRKQKAERAPIEMMALDTSKGANL